MKLLVVGVALNLLLCACERSTKHLVDGYKLERFDENGKYYLVGQSDGSGQGVFEGTVEEIGWDENWILARVTKVYHGDTNGWYALNLRSKQVVGPLTNSELTTNAVWSAIKCRESRQVFQMK